MSKRIAVLAIDIETSGPCLTKNKTVVIGYCLGDEFGNVLNKKRFLFDITSFDKFDKDSYEEFWLNMDKLNVFIKERKPAKLGMEEFINDIDKLDKIFDLRIISNNPASDIGFINYYLSSYLHREPLSYPLNLDDYPSIIDIDSYTRGVMNTDYIKSRVSEEAIMQALDYDVSPKHDHSPENDAEDIYRLHIGRINVLKTGKLMLNK
jgi:hypothetical protein